MDTESASSDSAGSSSEQETMLQALTGDGSAAADGVDAEASNGLRQHQAGGSSSSSSSNSDSSALIIMNVTEACDAPGGDLLMLPSVSTSREVQHQPNENERSEASSESLDGIRAGTLGGSLASTGSGLCILALNNCVRLGPVGMRVSHLAWPIAPHAVGPDAWDHALKMGMLRQAGPCKRPAAQSGNVDSLGRCHCVPGLP